jgi:hypothetical protein
MGSPFILNFMHLYYPSFSISLIVMANHAANLEANLARFQRTNYLAPLHSPTPAINRGILFNNLYFHFQ